MQFTKLVAKVVRLLSTFRTINLNNILVKNMCKGKFKHYLPFKGNVKDTIPILLSCIQIRITQ